MASPLPQPPPQEWKSAGCFRSAAPTWPGDPNSQARSSLAQRTPARSTGGDRPSGTDMNRVAAARTTGCYRKSVPGTPKHTGGSRIHAHEHRSQWREFARESLAARPGSRRRKGRSSQQPKNQPTPPNVMHPIAPRRHPFRPQFTYLFRLVLARSRCPSVSQASHFLAHLALLVPPEALCSPATSPKFSKRCPYGARLAPATGGAPATFSAAAARPPQQSSRRAPGGGFNPRPAPLFLLPARKATSVASQCH